MNLQNQIEYLHLYAGVDLFDNCTVPDGLDMERVKGAIIMRCGLLWPLFTDPMTQRMATQQFFAENQWNFEHIINIIRAEYSPIENVAEVRQEVTQGSGSDTLTIKKGSTETNSGTDGRIVQDSGTTADAQSGTTKTERKISAENVSTYSPDNEETVTHGRTDTTTHGKKTTDDFTHGHVKTTGGQDQHVTERGSKDTLSVNRHGNIGVTTNQDMINQELDLLKRFNPYRFIANLYEKELMLGIY